MRFSPKVLVFLGVAFFVIQSNLPSSLSLYAFFRIVDNQQVSNLSWYEISERENQLTGDREWIMVHGETQDGDVDFTCHSYTKYDSQLAIYLANGDIVPIDESGDGVFGQGEWSPTRKQMQSLIETAASCERQPHEPINGTAVESCKFENQSLRGVFKVENTATSSGEILFSVDNGYPVSYILSAIGQATSGNYQFQFQELSQDFDLQPPVGIGLQCFADGFPLADKVTAYQQINHRQAVFHSARSPGELEAEYNRLLKDDLSWQLKGNGRFTKNIDTNTICEARLVYTSQSGSSFITVTVSAKRTGPVELPSIFTSPAIISSPGGSYIKENTTVAAQVDQLVIFYAMEGWNKRDELSTQQDNSAFLALTKQGEEKYFIINQRGTGVEFSQPIDRPSYCGAISPLSVD